MGREAGPSTPGEQQPLPESGSGLAIVLNPRSGSAVLRADPRPTISERLPGAIVRELAEGEDVAHVVGAVMSGPDAPRVLGVYGGDGTVARVAHLARERGVPLLAMPGGTFNHFARALGIDDVDTAIDAYLGGATRQVTVLQASADDEPPLTVLNALSVGTYPAFLRQREQRHSQLGKWLGGIAAAWEELRGARPIAVIRGGRRATVWSVFVGAGRNEAGRIATMQRRSTDDGVLDIRIHHARGSRLRAMASLAFGRRTAAVLRAVGMMPPETDVERLIETRFEIRVRPLPGAPSVFVHDGELEGRDASGFTLVCTALPSALQVYAPAPSAE